MMMPGRTYTSGSSYRYGFNGKEQDPETYGEGNIYDYGFRIYNPRIGKFLSVDPLSMEYPWYTPFQFAGNKPIRFTDLDGAEEHDPMSNTDEFLIGLFEGIIGFNFDEVPIISTMGTEYKKWKAEAQAAKLNKDIAAKGVKESGVINWTFDQLGNMVGNLREVVINGTPRQKGRIVGTAVGIIVPIAGEAKAGISALKIANAEKIAIRTAVDAVGTEKLLLDAVTDASTKLINQGKATVIAISLKGEIKTGSSGLPPDVVAPQLKAAVEKLGGLGAKSNGNTVGCCSEFRTANDLLLGDKKAKVSDLKFSPAIRSRTGQKIESCENCKSMFEQLQKASGNE